MPDKEFVIRIRTESETAAIDATRERLAGLKQEAASTNEEAAAIGDKAGEGLDKITERAGEAGDALGELGKEAAGAGNEAAEAAAKAEQIVAGITRFVGLVGAAYAAGKFVQDAIIGIAENRRDAAEAEEDVIDAIVRGNRQLDEKIAKAATVEQQLRVEQQLSERIAEVKKQIHREESQRDPNQGVVDAAETELRLLDQQSGKIDRLIEITKAREAAEADVARRLDEQKRTMEAQTKIGSALGDAGRRIENAGADTAEARDSLERQRNLEAREKLRTEVKKFFGEELLADFNPDKVLQILADKKGLSAGTTQKLTQDAGALAESDARIKAAENKKAEDAKREEQRQSVKRDEIGLEEKLTELRAQGSEAEAARLELEERSRKISEETGAAYESVLAQQERIAANEAKIAANKKASLEAERGITAETSARLNLPGAQDAASSQTGQGRGGRRFDLRGRDITDAFTDSQRAGGLNPDANFAGLSGLAELQARNRGPLRDLLPTPPNGANGNLAQGQGVGGVTAAADKLGQGGDQLASAASQLEAAADRIGNGNQRLEAAITTLTARLDNIEATS